jgi:hypothetical protein
MPDLIAHPSDQVVYDSGLGSRRAYLKAYQAQERTAKLESQRQSNITPDVTRSASRFSPPASAEAIAARQRQFETRQIARGGVISAAPATPRNLIPHLDADSESKAAEAYWYIGYPHHRNTDKQEEGLLRFAKALHLIHYAAVFQKDDPIRKIALDIYRSDEATKRFAGRY